MFENYCPNIKGVWKLVSHYKGCLKIIVQIFRVFENKCLKNYGFWKWVNTLTLCAFLHYVHSLPHNRPVVPEEDDPPPPDTAGGITGEPEPMSEKDLREASAAIDVFGEPLVYTWLTLVYTNLS